MPLVYYYFRHTLRPAWFSQNIIVSSSICKDACRIWYLWFAWKFKTNATLLAVKCSLIHVNSLTAAWKMRTSPFFLPVCWNTMRLTENFTLHHTSCNYFNLCGITIATLTKAAIFHSEIIVQRHLCTLVVTKILKVL